MVLKALKKYIVILVGNCLWKYFERIFKERNEVSTPLLCRWKIISVMNACIINIDFRVSEWGRGHSSSFAMRVIL